MMVNCKGSSPNLRIIWEATFCSSSSDHGLVLFIVIPLKKQEIYLILNIFSTILPLRISDESSWLCTLLTKKFESLSIKLWYNALALIIFDYGFDTSSAKPKPFMNFSHNHNLPSQLQHSLVKFLNIEDRYSFSYVLGEM